MMIEYPVLFTNNKREKIILGYHINGGKEGEVYSLSPKSIISHYSYNNLVAKIYKDDVPQNLQNKLNHIISIKNSIIHTKDICFPLKLLYSKTKNKLKCRGFLMNRAYGEDLQSTVFQPKQVEDVMKWTRIELSILALTILDRFIWLHNNNILMADVNPFNILVSSYNKVYFIDVDSYQFEDKYPCTVHVPEFTSPRLITTKDFTNVYRSFYDEYYSIAVLLFKIFLVGKNPYSRCSGGSLERYIKEGNFVFPLGYNTNTEMPHGPWQAIWYNLPYDLREGFYKTFHDGDYLSPNEWVIIIKSYLEDLQCNKYNRVIFPNSKLSESLNPFDNLLKITINDVVIDKELRTFENIINSNASNGYVAFLEFGTNYFRGCDVNALEIIKEGIPLQRLKPYRISTCHFDYIDSKSNINIDKLSNVFFDKINNWIKSIMGIRPKIRSIYAFGGSILRNLYNRNDLINTIKKECGLSFGILNEQEETDLLLNGCFFFSKISSKKEIILLDVGGTCTNLLWRNTIQKNNRIQITNLGCRTLRNWLFSTARTNSNLNILLDEHDKAIEKEIRSAIPNELPKDGVIIGTGVSSNIKEINESTDKRSTHTNFTLEELQIIKAKLTKRLITNRPFVSILYKDVLASDGDSLLLDTIDTRLGISMYISMMKILKKNKIQFIDFGLHEAYILNYLKNLKNEKSESIQS